MPPVPGKPDAKGPAGPPPSRLRRAARKTLRVVTVLSERGRNTSSILLLSIALLLGAAISWASIAQLDEVTRSEGKVVPSTQLQVVQSLEGGIVRRIHVREGDRVDAGTPLMELDPTLHRSQYEQTLQQLYSQLAQAQRLDSEATGSDLTMPDELAKKAPVQVATEVSLYIGRQNELRMQLGALREQLSQKKQELAASEATLTGTERALVLASQSRDVIRRLVSKGLEAELTLIGEESKVNELENKLTVTQADVVRLNAAMQEGREKVETTVATFRSGALTELAKARGQIQELNAQLEGLRDRVQRATLVAPVAGVINRVQIKSLGAVAQPAQTLIELVPVEDSLMVEAYVKPSDIAFVYPGQLARVKVTAYDASRYGSLQGEIIKVSADSVQNPEGSPRAEQGGANSDVYVVTVRTKTAQLEKDGKVYDILPGMKAEVDIVKGKRTVMDYLVHPVTKITDRAFRESPH